MRASSLFVLADFHDYRDDFPWQTHWEFYLFFPHVHACGFVHVFSLWTWTCTMHICCNIRTNNSNITTISHLIWVVGHLNNSMFFMTCYSLGSLFSFMFLWTFAKYHLTWKEMIGLNLSIWGVLQTSSAPSWSHESPIWGFILVEWSEISFFSCEYSVFTVSPWVSM